MFDKFLKYDKPLHFSAWIVGLFLIGLLIWQSQGSPYYIYAAFGLMALPLIYLVINYPKLWIYALLLCNIKYFMDSDVGIDVFDVLAALLYFGGTLTWIIYHGFFKKEKLIRNYGDWFFTAFALISLLNFPIALLNDVEPLTWTREYITFILPFLYFPIRDIFKDRSDLKNMLIFFGISMVFTSILQIIYYKQHITENLVYMYQLGSPFRINQVLFTASAITILTFAFYARKLRNAALLLIMGSFTIFGILTSMSRTYWAFIFVYLFVVFLLIKPRSKIVVLVFLAVTSFSVYQGSKWILGNNAIKLVQTIAKRFESTTKGTKDYSWKLREKEYSYDYINIGNFPLGGMGYAKKFKMYDIALKFSRETVYTHNGYLSLSFKLGIPLAIMYVFWLLFYSVISFKTWMNSRTKFDKLLMAATTINFVMIFWSNVTATQFNSRDGAFIMAMLVSITGILLNLHKKENELNGIK